MELLKSVLCSILGAAYSAYYYTDMALYNAYLSAKWWAWNPWAIARLNLAWSKYIETTMYKERVKLWEFHTEKQFEDYGEQAYVRNVEVTLFINLFTRKEKMKMLFMPFSCGNKFRMPFYTITNLLIGGDE